MRRTLQINLQTTISILCVVSLAVVQGLPAASRTAPGEPPSSRRRSGDDLISGSDFLSMFIGDPTVRSRRFPLLGDASSRQLRPSEGQEVDAHPQRRANIIDPHERLSGLIRSQDRQNYRLDAHDSHNSNKVDHSEDLQRRGSAKFKYVHSIDSLDDPLDSVTEDSTTDDVSAPEDKIFGDRTLPRTSSNPPSSATTNVPTSVTVEATDSYSTSEDNSQSSTVINALNNQENSDTSEDYTHTANLDVTEKVSFSPKFSVSSSIKKFVSKESKNDDNQSKNEENSTSPNNNDNEVVKEQEDESRTSSSQTPSTESTTTEESSTTTSESSSEQNEDAMAEPTVTAIVEEIPDEVQFQKIGVAPETEVKVVSVRFSSSVAKKNPALNTILEETAPEYKQETSNESGPESVRLESVDHPPVTAIQRSELLVEESSPSEVTADPFSPYTSFLSTKFESPSTNLYHHPLEHTSPNPQDGTVSYQSSLTPASARRIHFFNHPPRTYPNPNLEALKRSSEDYGYLKANIQGGGSRRYATQRVREPEYQTLRQEPASVAESIQRSVIARQEADRVDLRGNNRGQFHQDKTAFADGRYQAEEDRNRKRYNQPERIWGEPEKVYGEPEKVYGEPEKVYGEPEKVYGQPEKVYGEPEKNYEVDEAVSVLSNGRAHGIQTSQGPAPSDSAIKMIDSKPQDPNHKFGYVVEGRNFRKYRVEERTSDGFIVGEYGVVSHDDGSLRGVRYTADDSINPRLIYDTLVKFLSL